MNNGPILERWRLRKVAIGIFLVLAICAPIFTGTSAGAVSAAIGHSWAGAQVDDQDGRNVWGASSSWVVPRVFCSKNEQSGSHDWVGVGGTTQTDPTLYQVGTYSDCYMGIPRYQGFYEKFVGTTRNSKPPCTGPADNTNKCFTAAVGDVIQASVVDNNRSTGNHRYTWRITDLRKQHVAWSQTGSWSITRHSGTAECIAEDPLLGRTDVPLSRFSPVKFSSCDVIDSVGHRFDMTRNDLPKGFLESTQVMEAEHGVPLATTELRPLVVTRVSAATRVLGHLWVGPQNGYPVQQGFGTVVPTIISYGGDPTSHVSTISWSTWGGPVALGEGMTDYQGDSPTVAGGTVEHVTVAAADPGLCEGQPAYLEMEWYFPQHGQTFTPSQLQNICTGTNPNSPNSQTYAPVVGDSAANLTAPTTTTTAPITIPPTTAPSTPSGSTFACNPATFANLMTPGVPPDGSLQIKYYSCQGEWALAAGYSSAGASVSLFQLVSKTWTLISGPDDGYCLAASAGQCSSSPPNLPLSSATIVSLAEAAGLTVDTEGDVVVPTPS